MTTADSTIALPTRPAPACAAEIRIRGARQNNLKGFDLNLPLGQVIVVTGLSGAGKSSLVFDTLHAEGQRRYVETFSAYTRQFLDLLAKPRVDAIENIRPSIAIAQNNTVRTSRSTVGTMTELTDYCKVWFSHVAQCFDPETGERVEDDNPQTIWAKTLAAQAGRTLVVTFKVEQPPSLKLGEIVSNLTAQGYTRCLQASSTRVVKRETNRIGNDAVDFTFHNLTPAPAASDSSVTPISPPLYVLQDRVTIGPENKGRFIEAVEAALHFGRGEVHLFAPADPAIAGSDGSWLLAGRYSRGLHSPSTGRTFHAPIPGLFSFNSPLGACPQCRGFGRVIEIDTRLAVPDLSLSIDGGAIKCWESDVYGESKDDLRVFARRRKIPTDVPLAELTPEQRAFVIDGEPGYGEENGKTWPRHWYGVKGFFRWLEKHTYKMHVRVFLSRYRTYSLCPACGGARLKPEALCWRWQGRTLPDLYRLPVGVFLELVAAAEPIRSEGGAEARSAELARTSILTRLRYLREVGLDYLTLDRPTKTLSGGEVERVNLTSCLGTSLVDTLFVLDEPSVGLHSRDLHRLIRITRALAEAGNTVVIVEHDESVIRAADQVIEIGPAPGAGGGHVVFQGTVADMANSPHSITGAYLSGRQTIEVPRRRRPVSTPSPGGWLRFANASKHNLSRLTFQFPLQRLVCLSGVSGSGKSTLLDHVVCQGLRAHRGEQAEDAAEIESISGGDKLAEVVLVDQSPLTRTSRSNPALYTGAWELIRELFASTPAAQAAGYDASSFSFNAGDGRCDHCHGLGYERVEMQFLSDVYVPCPVCDGERFKPEVLAIAWNRRSVADLLRCTVAEAMPLFREYPEIHARLAALASVGLGYLALGQPLTTLSGGESQRLKLVKYLSGFTEDRPGGGAALLLLDEPTTGLHRHDVRTLLGVFQALVDRGHSLVVIEHNLDVLKVADWILEIGPEAGAAGGRIVAEGDPEAIAAADTATSPFLREALRGRVAGSEMDRVGEDPAHFTSGDQTPPPAVLTVTGARENNLKNLSLTLPHHKLNVVTGVSGSGKSTLAFDIIFAEGQRRFMESMSPYARQFVEQLPRAAVDRLSGIPPTVAIEQRISRGSRKSTVATVTEIAPYLRLLYARLGVQHHPATGRPVAALSSEGLRKLFLQVRESPAARKARHLYLCAPLIRARKGHHQPIATWIRRQGYRLMRVDRRLIPVQAFQKLDRYVEHDIEVVVADLKVLPAKLPATPASAEASAKADLSKFGSVALETALELGRGSCFLLAPNGKILSWFSTTRTDAETGESFPELDPKHFSFNSPRGWCPACRGHGRIFPWMLEAEDEDDDPLQRLRVFGIDSSDDITEGGRPCPECGGERLNRISRAVKLHFRGRPPLTLPALLRQTPADLRRSLRGLELNRRARLILQDIKPQIEQRLRFLEQVGLGYLALDRPTETLSGGESQRIRLAAQLGSDLSGVLYILDEPSIGLHAGDNQRLIETLHALRAKGNTLLVVEHDDEVMAQSDHIIDLGPGAGIHGGELLASGTPAEIKRSERSLTGLFLKRGIPHPLRGRYRALPVADPGRPAGADPAWLEIKGAAFRNLRGFDLRLPLGRLIMVAGPSGAGKSTLFRDVLQPALACAISLGKTRLSGKEFVARTGFTGEEPADGDGRPPLPFAELRTAGGFRSVITVDQAPIGKTPRSTPATYLGIFDAIRKFFATLPEAKLRGYNASRFSFNTAGGRCPTCDGAGRLKFGMAFLPDTYLPCEDCAGGRYGPELAEIRWKGRSIGEVLALTFEEASSFFDFHAHLGPVCRLMSDCGLGYLTLGQSSPSLSGGEAQRLKLVTELSRGLATWKDRKRGLIRRNFYLLEEPTIGLHLSDCEKLIRVLHSLVEQGHTVVVIEHNLDLLAEADYVVELGPGGGPAGGNLIYQGPLAGLMRVRRSPTAPFLRRKIKA